MTIINNIGLLQQLIACKSITPLDDGALSIIADILTKLNFKCDFHEFHQEGHPSVLNLYARLGSTTPNLCFAGHTDVVPTGPLDQWKYNPFLPVIENEVIYGRGVVDMKGAIAAFISAVSLFLHNHSITTPKNFSISFLITGDEEGIAVNGTKKLLDLLKANDENITACLVGEPASQYVIGDTIKVGARGSATFFLEIKGKQGHVAYNILADNALSKLIMTLNNIMNIKLDKKAKGFDQSNLEITNIIVKNDAENLIPGKALAQFNVRYNSAYTASTLHDKIRQILLNTLNESEFDLTYRSSGDAFYSTFSPFTAMVQDAIYSVTQKIPALNTSGGTSDARFIKDHCTVLEVGLLGKTAHQVNECSRIADIDTLTNIYYSIIKNYACSCLS